MFVEGEVTTEPNNHSSNSRKNKNTGRENVYRKTML